MPEFQSKCSDGIKQVGKSSKDLLDADKQKQTYLVELKFEGKSYYIGQEMWDEMNRHALERGMTLDEYIAEAFTKLKEQNEARQKTST